MPPWLLPYLAPALGAIATGAGAWIANRSNAQQARRQMEFQERMSNTAAQRSVHDYGAAGLNTALAYDRSASSPGGAQAQIGDPVAAAVSTAQSARALQQQMQINREQHAENLRNTRANTQKTAIEGQNAEATGALLHQQFRFNALNQPVDLRERAARAALSEYMLPGAKNTADWERSLGRGGPLLNTARTASEVLKTLIPRVYK